MDWGSLKFFINSMTPEQLRQQVRVYDPYFGRTTDIVALDSYDSVVNGNPTKESPLVLVSAKERK